MNPGPVTKGGNPLKALTGGKSKKNYKNKSKKRGGKRSTMKNRSRRRR